jgi:uncharacterized protein (TIGR02246 family)
VKNLLPILALVATLNAVQAQTSSDTAAIHQVLKDEAEGWSKGDAVTYSRHFADEGTFTNIMGMFFTGHETFLKRHDEIFKGMFSNTNFHQSIVSFRFVRPDVAVVETLTTVTGFSRSALPPFIHVDDQNRLKTRLLQVLHKTGEEWKIVVYHNVDLKPGIAP